MRPILAIDFGSTHVKACLLKGNEIFGKVVTVPLHTTRRGQEAEVTVDAVERVIQSITEAFSSNHKISAIVLANQSPSLTILSKSGHLLFPVITHQDRRSTSEATELEKEFGQSFWLKTIGNRPYPGGIAATSLLWIRKHYPRILGKASCLGSLNTYFLKRWTDSVAIDPANASYLGTFDSVSLAGWNFAISRYLGIENLLPEVKDANEVGGRLNKEFARKLGCQSGIPVYVGTIDTSASAVGCGLRSGDLLHISGTTDVLATLIPQATPSPKYLTRPLGVGRKWLALHSIAAGGSTLEWCHKTFGSSKPRTLSKTTLKFEPYLSGDRLSIEPRFASFQNITIGHTSQDFIDAIYEGLDAKSQEGIRSLTEMLQKQGKKMTGRVWSTGGNERFSRRLHRSWKQWKNLQWSFNYNPNLCFEGLAQLANGNTSQESR